MPFLLVVLFIVVPIAELAVLIQIGELIGVWWTIALLVADAVLGSILARSQGRTAWRRFNDTVAAGRMPGREAIDGALVLFGAALLLTPGFLSDILGIVLLLPPTRAVVRRILVRRFAARMVVSMSAPRGQSGPRARQAYDVEGSAVDAPPDGLDAGQRPAT
ncbi:MAG TPA: FxsA family protein [Solirubrobacteraceae bacterium]|nr:FxsA family protein [Solirubrobacteraceae bacterium]